MRRHFDLQWTDPEHYDLVLNTDRLTVPSCVELIRQLSTRPEFQETAASRQLLANMTLVTRVRAALKADPATQEVNITVQAENGRVMLSGIVVNAHERTEVERVSAQVEGVTGVENSLRQMKPTRSFTYAKTS